MLNKKHKWEIVAQDYNAPFIKNYIFTKSFFIQARLLNIPQAALGVISQKNQIEFFTDFSMWQKAHDGLIKRVRRNLNYVENLIGITDKWCRQMNKWTEDNLLRADLGKLNGKKLISLLKKFTELQAISYAYGVSLPILDFGDFSFVEGNLEKYLKENVDKKNYQKYYSAFTEPVHNSFAQDQEEDLLKLMGKFYKNDKWRKDIKSRTIEEIRKMYPRFYSLLKRHTKKYCWVYYVFIGPAYIEQDFLGFIKDYLERKINPLQKLEKIKKRKKKNKVLKREYIKELKPDKFNLTVINLSGKVIWAKPRRKDYQSKSYYHFETLMKEIAKRLHISLNQARSAPIEILDDALIKNKEIDIDTVNKIYDFHICVPMDNGKVKIMYGREARDFYKTSVKKESIKIKKNIKELKGATAVSGKVKGAVKIVNQPSEMDKMNYGDILVSAATTPSIVPAMKKAGAIITDEGGLTCHASIVSRELNTPCIVGLKIATKVLCDGDLVEVDADKGFVKIIK